MFRKRMTILVVVLFSLAAVIPVFAAAPATGTVYEGVSVPGVALGDTRAQVDTAFGNPASCTTGYEVDDDAICDYQVEGLNHLGHIRIRYRGPDGGLPSASPDDVAYSITWNDLVPGWVTDIGGVNTEWASSVREDPEAVLAVYPDAEISYGLFGVMTRATVYELGITIEWVYHFYSGFLGVRMGIFEPRDPPPPPPPRDPFTYVSSISMYANKLKGKRTVWAYVWVDDEYWSDVVGATVVVDWTYPDGSTQRLEALTSEDAGMARFEMQNVKTGTHTLEVVDVIYLDHPFDRERSALTHSLKVK